ncbi:hypothetical protein, partial [Castellaniella denitrificans]
MTTALTDLEARLAAPGGAALRDALSARAAHMEAALRARMAAGLPRENFPVWRDIADAPGGAGGGGGGGARPPRGPPPPPRAPGPRGGGF